MTEQLKDLIKKIQDEGVKTAEEKARLIEQEAKRQADALLKKAENEASTIISAAKQDAQTLYESTKASLKQAARDVLLCLRQQIEESLNKIISANIHQALSPQELLPILSSLVKNAHATKDGEIVVSLNKQDKEKLESSFIGELKDLVKHGLVLKSKDDIGAGFTISYDAGRSMFDFTDKALSEYISLYIKPKLSEILSESSSK